MDFVRVVKKLIPATMSLMFAFLPWKLFAILCKKWSSRKDKLDKDAPLPVADEHHCADCLCKNPGLVAILLGEKNDLGSGGHLHNADINLNKCSTIDTMNRKKIVQIIDTNEFSVIATNVSFGMKLTRAYLKKCRNPDFLNKQLKLIEEHFQRMVTKLNKVKEKLLARYESTSDSVKPKLKVVNKVDSKSDATLKQENVHCGGCLCNNPGIITTLRESGRLSSNPEDSKMQTENLAESSFPSANFILPLFADDGFNKSQNIALGQYPQDTIFISSGLQFGLSYTREYLEMCKDQAFLAEQIKLIQEEGNQQQQKLSKLKQSLQHRQKTCNKLLNELAYPLLG